MDWRVLRSLGFGLSLLVMTGGLVGPAGGDTEPAVVTTDSPAYCQTLFERIRQAIQAATTPPPVEVASLSTEGNRMCNDGLMRGGILRLRRALLILEQGPAAP